MRGQYKKEDRLIFFCNNGTINGTNVKYTEMMPEAKFNLFKGKLPDWKNQYYLIGYKGKLAQNGARHSEEFAGKLVNSVNNYGSS